MALLTGARTAGITIGAALALTIVASATSFAQIIVPGYPYPAYPGYRYAERDASVRFDVKPKEAAIYIDGYYAGIVDDFDGAFERLRTAPGGHEITIYLEGYRTHSERVYLTFDNTLKIRHRLERLPAGETAARPPAPAPQPPQYEPGDGGPQGASGPAVPYPRGPVGRRGGLPLPPPGARPAEANGRGTLSLLLEPSDADVLVDGTPWAGAPQDRLTIDLSEGRHNLQIRKRGYVGYLTDVQIRSGETTTLEVRLKTQP